jgi:hypothetical protein
MSKHQHRAQAVRQVADETVAALMSQLDQTVSAALSPTIDLALQTGPGTSADYTALTRVLGKLATHRLGDFSDQLAAFEREVVAMELNPNYRDFYDVRYALETMAALSEVFEDKEWTPGREDLTPLFDIDELTAS